MYSSVRMAEKKLLHDSLSEDEARPPPYTDQPKPSKVVQLSVAEGPHVRVKDPSLNTIYIGLFAMLFCCWPCGLAAVILGVQALQSHYQGELHETRRKNTLAKRCTIASIVVGVLFIIAFMGILVVEYFALLKIMKAARNLPTDPVPVY